MEQVYNKVKANSRFLKLLKEIHKTTLKKEDATTPVAPTTQTGTQVQQATQQPDPAVQQAQQAVTNANKQKAQAIQAALQQAQQKVAKHVSDGTEMDKDTIAAIQSLAANTQQQTQPTT